MATLGTNPPSRFRITRALASYCSLVYSTEQTPLQLRTADTAEPVIFSAGLAAGGAGLGLAIAKQIIERHNGSIMARSENETVEFKVTLPIS